MALIQAKEIVVGVLASIFAMVMDWILEGKFSVKHALLLCAASMGTVALASVVLDRLKMEAKRDFNSPESRNWLKQWQAVFITRRALIPCVKSEATRLHNGILQKASIEQTCSTDHGHVSNQLTIHCRFHEKLRQEIKIIHKRTNPSWRNASTDTWRDSPFAVAKLFMQSSGYDDKSSFDEIDFNGLAACMYNCGRFKHTLETLTDEARKYVNKIRHMPDVCSSALTDQATTECIDSMIAVLNDPYFQGDPEILKARKQLDELKTRCQDPNPDLLNYIIEDAAIRGVQNVLDLASAKESEWRDHANEIKDDIEKLGGIAMSSLGKQEESAINDIKQTFEDALAKMDSCIDNANKSMIETTEESIFSLKNSAQSEKLKLEEATMHGIREQQETTLDGKRELNLTAKKEKRKFKKTCESATKNIKEIAKSESNKLTRGEGEEQRKSKLTKAKSDLKKLLLNHYQETSVRINVRLDIDAAVEDIYEKPKLLLKNKKDKDGNIKDEEISEIHQMFLSDNDTMVKTVFVEGEPGYGKSILCKKIVHSWCKFKHGVNEEKRKDNPLSQFEFLFYVKLREFEDQCKIKDIIFQFIIEQIQSEYTGLNELLTDVLRSDHCLLLLDGLDEWKHCSECKRIERIPHVETCWVNCTTFITTRPYKLAELKLNRSQLGNHVQLQGLQLPTELVRKILVELDKDQVEISSETCVKDLDKKGLWHFRDVPIVLVNIVWLWFRNKLQDNMSLSEVFRVIIDERWYEMCEKKNIEAEEPPIKFLNSVSELAFHQLFSASKDESIVFQIKGDQYDYIRDSLESGIMSCSKKSGERSAYYQFLHKTLQEYFAALYLAKHTSDLSRDIQHILNVYMDNRKEDVFSLGQMFKFLCGLSVHAAEQFSKILNELFTEYCERGSYSMEIATTFQDMIYRGYEEAGRSGHSGMDLYLQHIALAGGSPFIHQDLKAEKKTMLKPYLDERKSTLASLLIEGEKDLCSVLQYKEDPSVLDLGMCKNLKFIALTELKFTDIKQLHLNGLLECEITFRKFQPANLLVSSLLLSDLTSLKTLTLGDFDWESKVKEIVAKLENIQQLHLEWSGNRPLNDLQFDLGHLENLKQLTLYKLACSDVVISPKLKLNTLIVKFSTLQKAPQLIAALLAQHDYLRSSNQDRPLSYLTEVILGNILMSAGVFRRIISMAIQSGDYVSYDLENCTIEPEEDEMQQEVDIENRPAFQIEAPDPFSTDDHPYITLERMTMSAGELRRLISMVIHSGLALHCEIVYCTITPEEDERQLTMDIKTQPALQMVGLRPSFTDITQHIKFVGMSMPIGMLISIFSMMNQSQNTVKFELVDTYTEEPDEDVRELQVDIENQPAFNLREINQSGLWPITLTFNAKRGRHREESQDDTL
ncbi:uncharacterized protein LOC128221360 [Mya arenaria]|nr:uncharacterized protein LOC128221360 [Mya arenaria]XP_052785920.1 uncharacterized protein LOC128221360 [Mya arenaria]